MIEVRQGIEAVEGLDLGDGIQADEALIIFVIGPASLQGNGVLLRSSHEQSIKELRAVTLMLISGFMALLSVTFSFERTIPLR